MSLKCYIISLLVPIHCLNSLSFPHQLSSPYHLSEVGTSLFFCLQSLFESGAVNWTPANLMTKKNIFSCKTEEKKKNSHVCIDVSLFYVISTCSCHITCSFFFFNERVNIFRCFSGCNTFQKELWEILWLHDTSGRH